MDIPEDFVDLVTEDHVGFLATVNPDGSPQVTPIWVDWDGKHVVFNTAKGRKKYRNIIHEPRIAITVVDKNNPYRYISLQLKVVEILEEQTQAREHIAQLGVRYFGKEFIPPEEETRVIVKSTIRHIHASG